MLCPLQSHRVDWHGQSQDQYVEEGCTTDCGWWDQATDQCSVLSIKNALLKIAKAVASANK